MKYGVIFSMLIVIAILLTSVGLEAEIEIALEAELADVILAPMVVADDELASDGKYVWVEGQPLIGGGGSGYVELIINIPEAGKYALWGSVIAWDGNSDSLWVTWQPADPDEDPQQTQNTEYRWSLAGGNDWHWDRINHWLDGGTFEREWDLPAGETTLRVGVREDAAKLDVIFITDNLSADEAEASPRDPGPQDVTPVEPKGKLTTTWGKLKAQR
jgi:hypothetical protein